jgi:hypothetical protein
MTADWPDVPLSQWISNAGAQLVWTLGLHEPLAITRTMTPRCGDMAYITSLRSHWFDYAADELGPDSLKGVIVRLAGQVAGLMGIDRLSLIGNEPISTVLRTPAQNQVLLQTAETEHTDYPDHWIGIRNLLPSRHSDLIQSLIAQDYVMVPTRVVYLFDASHVPLRPASHLVRDRKLLKKSGLKDEVVKGLDEADIKRVTKLYHDVYLNKHSRLNANYRPQFFSDMLASGAMECLVLRDDSAIIRSFAMLRRIGSDLIAPAVGHDIDQPEAGHYRQLFAALSNYVDQHKLRLNYSSGAGDYKRKRGGIGELEMTAIKAPLNAAISRRMLALLARQCDKLTLEMMIANGA